MKTLKIKDTHVVIAHIISFELGTQPVETLSSKRPKPRIAALRISLTGGDVLVVKGTDAESTYKILCSIFE